MNEAQPPPFRLQAANINCSSANPAAAATPTAYLLPQPAIEIDSLVLSTAPIYLSNPTLLPNLYGKSEKYKELTKAATPHNRNFPFANSVAVNLWNPKSISMSSNSDLLLAKVRRKVQPAKAKITTANRNDSSENPPPTAAKCTAKKRRTKSTSSVASKKCEKVSYIEPSALSSNSPATVAAATKRQQEIHRCSWSGCNIQFMRVSSLQRHLRSHEGKKCHTCKHLVQKLDIRGQLVSSECGLHFSELGNLKRHERLHVMDKIYPCSFKVSSTGEQCQERFTHRSQLLQHIRSSHDGTITSLPPVHIQNTKISTVNGYGYRMKISEELNNQSSHNANSTTPKRKRTGQEELVLVSISAPVSPQHQIDCNLPDFLSLEFAQTAPAMFSNNSIHCQKVEVNDQSVAAAAQIANNTDRICFSALKDSLYEDLQLSSGQLNFSNMASLDISPTSPELAISSSTINSSNANTSSNRRGQEVGKYYPAGLLPASATSANNNLNLDSFNQLVTANRIHSSSTNSLNSLAVEIPSIGPLHSLNEWSSCVNSLEALDCTISFEENNLLQPPNFYSQAESNIINVTSNSAITDDSSGNISPINLDFNLRTLLDFQFNLTEDLD
jgi:hypothetical protein